MADIKKLIEQAIVLEGLLRNIEAQNGRQFPEYLSLLNEKFEEFQEAYYTMFPPNNSFNDNNNDDEAEVIDIVDVDEEETPRAETTAPQPQQWPADITPTPKPAPKPMPQPQPTQAYRTTPMPGAATQQPYNPTPIPGIAPQQPLRTTPMPGTAPQQAFRTTPMPGAMPQQQPYNNSHTPAPDPKPQQPRVDDMLSMRKAENLSKAFTINDKYRFGRDLYYGNNELMNEQIKSAQNFNNYQQAYDLFVSGNNWDPENPVVQEFMAIISRHFQQL